jgi:hypothetical protein
VGGASRFHTEGTGLGLYVAKQIVKEHHGDVGVTSPGPEQGSTFLIRLPVEGSSNSLKVGQKVNVEIKAAETQTTPGSDQKLEIPAVPGVTTESDKPTPETPK